MLLCVSGRMRLVLSSPFVHVVRLRSQILGKLIGVLNAQLCHELLLLRRSGLPRAQGGVQNWWRFRSDRHKAIQLLPEEVRFVREENVGSLNLSKVEPLRRDLLVRIDKIVRVDEGSNKTTEILGSIDNTRQALFLVGLKGQLGNLCLPGLEILQLWACRIAGNLDTPITNRTCIVLVFLVFTTSNFQALAMIPVTCVSFS